MAIEEPLSQLEPAVELETGIFRQEWHSWLGRLTAGVRAVEDQIVTVDLSALEADVAALQADMLTAQGDITSLQASITILQTTHVTGPASATNLAAAQFSGTSGKLIQNTNLLIATATGALSRSGGGGIQVEGTNTSGNAPAGAIGEFQENINGGLALANSTATNLCQMNLTAGDWDVYGSVLYATGSANITGMFAGISTTSVNVVSPYYTQLTLAFTASNNQAIPVPPRRLSLSATTTVFLVVWVSFSIGSVVGSGSLWARRAR